MTRDPSKKINNQESRVKLFQTIIIILFYTDRKGAL